MGRRHRVALAAGLVSLVAACRSGTVTLVYRPEVGDEARYRYELEGTISQALDGDEPTTIALQTTLLADQEVDEVGRAGVRATVSLRRDGGAARTSVVRLDRGGTLQGLDLVAGQRADVLGLDALAGVLSTVALPEAPLAPGDRWAVEEPGIEGHGRLDRLGVVDGRDVAVVRTRTTQPLSSMVPVGATTADLAGRLRSDGRATYELADGSLRRATTHTTGEVEARIAPPPGVDAEPVVATITYDLRVRVVRLR